MVNHLEPAVEEPDRDSFRYWSQKHVEEGVAAGTVVQGPIRINPKDYRQCFVPHPSGRIDIYVPWRNRAMNGDIVSVYLMSRNLNKVDVNSLEQYAKLNNLTVNRPSSHNPQRGGTASSPKSADTSFTVQDRLEYTRLGEFVAVNPELISSLEEEFSVDIPDKYLQPVGTVVSIAEEKNTRIVSGNLQPRANNNQFALLAPRDSRVPRIDIPISQCPKDFLKRPQDFSKVLFAAQITQWRENVARANGELLRVIGSPSEIEPVTEAIFMEHGIDYDSFSPEVEGCLPTQSPWVIPAEEYRTRRDFTKECVFTIDPATARDLDDALSVKAIGKDTYEVGVHIADVSYFIQEGSALDRAAASRATSVYMVQKVVPMLPRLLCEQLCSLNPDVERLAFSVVWHIDSEGNVTDEWFGRTIIKSCAKLSYQHAQGFIENPERVWKEDELPPISEGFSIDDIKEKVLLLDKMAKCMRKRRFDGGALRLQQIKLSYILNPDTFYPTGYYVYQIKDSNKLVEEFMLLANMAVARKIYRAFPDAAVLRRHPEPQAKMLSDLELACEGMGLHIDTSSSQSIQESIMQYMPADTDSVESNGKLQILMQLCTKPMQKALYFCTGSLKDEALFRHYALSVPFYTHFTSPIRRYPDVMVHRLLAASLGYVEPPRADNKQMEAQARHCNDKKDNAKKAGDLSVEVFFVAALKARGSITERAMVMGVLSQAIDIVCIELGFKKRIYTNSLKLKGMPVFKHEGTNPTLTLAWPTDDGQVTHQTIKLFDIVTCQLRAEDDLFKFQVVLMHPSEAACLSSSTPCMDPSL